MIDYHVHLWPHAERADEEELALERIAAYVELARSRGVGEIALTEHFFRFRQGRAVVDRWWDEFGSGPLPAFAEAYFDHHATADLDNYVEMVAKAKRAGLPVVLGLEVDYYPGRMDKVGALLDGYPFDVLLGSVHWLGDWLFDVLDAAAELNEWDARPIEETWRAYARAVEEMAGSGVADVLAHPDLVKLGRRFPADSVVAECEERIAEAAAGSGVAAEISSAGKKNAGEDYPSPSLLARFSERGVPVTFASDTHGSARVAERNAELVTAARAAGYSAVAAFSHRDERRLDFGAAAPDRMKDAPARKPR